METSDNSVFDTRLKKPVIFRDKSTNAEITTQQIETYNVGNAEITFPTPNIISIFLNIAEKEIDAAKGIYNSLIEPIENKKIKKALTESEVIKLFDYLEHVRTCIITLYSAIESLSNIIIPGEYIFEKRNSKGVKELWNKTAIERWLTTSEKLIKVIPNALNIESPATYKFWNDFKELEQLRNDIIRVKHDSLTNKENDKKIISLLINESIFKKIRAGMLLINELAINIPSHYEFPILNGTEVLIPIEVDSFEKSFSKTKQ